MTPTTSAQYSSGDTSADGTEPGAVEDRTDAVLVVEIPDATTDEYATVMRAVQGALVPLSVASRIRLHAAIKDVAERVMEAFDGE